VSDTFTRDLFAWIKQVTRDPELGHFAVRVAMVLVDYVNRDAWEAWPSQETVASHIGATSRGVRKAIGELEARGHVEVHAGRGTNSRYRPVLITANPGTAVPHHPGTAVPQLEAQPRNGCSSDPGTAVPQPRNGRSYEPSEEPSEENRETPSQTLPHAELAFAAWWGCYPLKAAKLDARAKFIEAVELRKATAAELLEGAQAYAEHIAWRRSQDPTFREHFVKTPVRWLEGGHWADEHRASAPAPATGALGYALSQVGFIEPAPLAPSMPQRRALA